MKIAIILIISFSMAFTQTINEQIKSLESLSPKERVNVMNHIKEQLIEMNRNERMRTIEKLRAKMNPQPEKNIKVENYPVYHNNTHDVQGRSNEGKDTPIDSPMNMEADHVRDSMHERFSREFIEHSRETSHQEFQPPQNQGGERQPSRNNSAEEFRPPENQGGEREPSRNNSAEEFRPPENQGGEREPSRNNSAEEFRPPQNQGGEREPSRNNSAEEFRPPQNQGEEREPSSNNHNTMNER